MGENKRSENLTVEPVIVIALLFYKFIDNGTEMKSITIEFIFVSVFKAKRLIKTAKLIVNQPCLYALLP